MILAYLMQISGFDDFLQHFFFDAEQKAWLVDAHHPLYKKIFYHLPKVILMGTGAAVFIRVIFEMYYKRTFPRYWIFILSIILVPTINALLKEITFTYCPLQLKDFGGYKDFRALFDFQDVMLQWEGRGKCFPAGHATTGFSLMSLYFVFEKKALRYAGLIMGMSLGWIMAFYQIMKGAHFFSHSVATMLLSWAIILGIKEVYERLAKEYT